MRRAPRSAFLQNPRRKMWVKTYERSWSVRFDRLEVVLEELKQKEEGNGSDE